jgi:hypothetical protein
MLENDRPDRNAKKAWKLYTRRSCVAILSISTITVARRAGRFGLSTSVATHCE